MSKRKIVVVLGAHRSGTSLVMQALGRLGVDPGPGCLEADEWNAEGYQEHPEIYETQDEILESIGRRWETTSGTQFFPRGWQDRPAVREQRARLVEFVRDRLRSTPGVWGFKDPRTASLLPMWNEIFRELDVEPVYVLAVRHPDSVAQSLGRRNGFPHAQSNLLWMRTYIDAVRHGEGKIGAVVHYEDWFRSPELPARALAGAVDRVLGQIISDPGRIQSVVHGELRNCDVTVDPVHADVAELYRLLRDARLDEIPAFEDRVARLATGWSAGSWGESCHLLNRFDPALVDGCGESHGPPAELWTVRLGRASSRCLMLQPPACARFEIPDGTAGELRFAVALHPEVWEKEGSGACQFELEIDQRVRVMIAIDPHGFRPDRRWHEFRVTVPHNEDGRHHVALKTKEIGQRDHRWALWREPVFTADRLAEVRTPEAVPA